MNLAKDQPSQLPSRRNLIEHPTAQDIHGLTDAELLRRGLPLNEPVIRRGAFMCSRSSRVAPSDAFV